MFVIAGGDYLYNFFSLEKKLKMTKQEVREEFKRREVDPHLKGRMRRMQRDLATRKVVEKTKEATVLLTNPTHYSIALKYEIGMAAPIVLAKGIDFLALKMREVAKEQKIPIIENRPLARELYATVDEGREIPDKLYKAVAEIIRYVFKLKGKAVPVRDNAAKPNSKETNVDMS
jgi:flagellar biosynthetic protein FlhB